MTLRTRDIYVAIVGVFASMLLLLATYTPARAQTPFLQAQGKDLVFGNTKVVLKGTNFDNVAALGARIGSGNINDIRIVEFDYQELAKHGGNHARLGLSFSWYQKDRALFFQKMDQHVAWARKHGIFLVFNMFTTPGDCYEGYSNICGFWNSTAEQGEMRDFWVDMAQRYKNEPAVAGYDILNEPNPGQGCDHWFRIAGNIRNAIASIAPNQLVFIASCSGPESLGSSALPRGKNIVYQVHDYSPMDHSHDMFSPGSVYPGYAEEWFGRCYFNKATFSGQPHPGDPASCRALVDIRERYMFNWAAQNSVPIYVGEWGATSRLQGYVQYHKDKAELYRDWGVNHAHYTWRHQTIVTGGHHQWGIYRDANPTSLDDPAKLEAVKIAWVGAVRPNFGAGTASPTSAVTTTPVPPSNGAATVTPVATRTTAPVPQPSTTAAPSPSGLQFIRGLNLGGPAVTVEGNLLAAERDVSGLTVNGTPQENRWLELKPTTDSATSSLLRTWRQHWAFDLAFSNVPNGNYQVYVYVVQSWNDPNRPTVSFSLEGRTVGSHTQGDAGSWKKLGPFSVTMNDGTLNLSARGMINVAGVELWQETRTAPAPTAATTPPGSGSTATAMPSAPTATSAPSTGPGFYRGVNLGGPGVTIGDNLLAGERDVAGLTVNGAMQANQWFQLTPAPDAATASLLRTWRQHWEFSLALAGVPSGNYQVYVYVVQDWNDPSHPTVSFSLEGRSVGSHTQGDAGSWKRLGPFSASVSDGTLNLSARGLINIAGVEVWRTP